MHIFSKPDINEKITNLGKQLSLTPTEMIVMHHSALVLLGHISSSTEVLVGIPADTFTSLDLRAWVHTTGRDVCELHGVLLTPVKGALRWLKGEWVKYDENIILTSSTDDIKIELSSSDSLIDKLHLDVLSCI